MTFEKFVEELKISENEKEMLVPWWSEEDITEELPYFFKIEYFNEYKSCFREEDVAEAAERVCKVAAETPVLWTYANMLMRLVWFRDDGPSIAKFPVPEALLGKDAGVFSLLVAMASLKYAREAYQKLGLPEETIFGVVRWIVGTNDLHRLAHNGLPGHCLQQLFWLKYYMRGKLFGVGRFEYLLEPVNPDFPHIYKSKKTGEVVAFCRDTWLIAEDGYRYYNQSAGCGNSFFEKTDTTISGIAIDLKAGKIDINNKRTVSAEEFLPVLEDGDLVPGIHIPAGGRMSPEVVKETLKMAVEFFKKYFNIDIKLFSCYSWLFNPDLRDELPNSNIVKFMDMANLFPAQPSPKSGMFFIFGKEDDDWSDYPCDNPVRKAFHNLRLSGKPLRAGGMFLLTDDPLFK